MVLGSANNRRNPNSPRWGRSLTVMSTLIQCCQHVQESEYTVLRVRVLCQLHHQPVLDTLPSEGRYRRVFSYSYPPSSWVRCSTSKARIDGVVTMDSSRRDEL